MCSKVTEEKNRKSSRKLVFMKESFGETMLVECPKNKAKIHMTPLLTLAMQAS
jgi:hypothetical protein